MTFACETLTLNELNELCRLEFSEQVLSASSLLPRKAFSTDVSEGLHSSFRIISTSRKHLCSKDRFHTFKVILGDGGAGGNVQQL